MMSRLIKTILSFVLFFGVFYIGINLLIAVSTAFTPKVEKLLLRHTAVSKYEYQRIKELEIWLQQSDAKKTALILGSSTAYMNINPQILTTSTGIDFFNCGTNVQTISYSEKILSHVIKKHKPDYLLLDVSPGAWNISTREAATEWLVNHSKPWNSLIVQMITDEGSATLWNHYFYFLIKRQLPFAKDRLTDSISSNSIYKGSGHVCLNDVIPNYRAEAASYVKLKAENTKALRQIEHLCTNNNIRLIILLPDPLNAIVNENLIKTTAPVIYARSGVNRSYYRDSHHFNCGGAELFSYWLANRINEVIANEK